MTVRFEAEVNDGNISIPDNLCNQLKNKVMVSVTVKELEKPEDEPYDIISELRENPIKDPNFIPFKRDEIYDRNL